MDFLYPVFRERAETRKPLYHIARDGTVFIATAVSNLHWGGEAKTYHAVKVSVPQIGREIGFHEAYCGRPSDWEQPTERQEVNCPKCLARLARLKEPSF